MAYLVLVVHVLVAAVSGGDIGVSEHTGLWHIGTVAIALTFAQWPFYFLWVGLSRELTLRQKSAWWIVMFSGNMVAMPYFLWCKYRRKTVDGLLSVIGRKRIRNYFGGTTEELEQDESKEMHGMKKGKSKTIIGTTMVTIAAVLYIIVPAVLKFSAFATAQAGAPPEELIQYMHFALFAMAAGLVIGIPGFITLVVGIVQTRRSKTTQL